MREIKPILLVEDDVIDAMTVRRAFKELNLKNPLTHVTNGEEALDYLQKAEPLPCVILLDLNMPRMNGVEFIRAAKADPALKSIPIIVLTTSRDHSDVTDSYSLSVAGYIVKPVDYGGFVEVVRTLGLYWTINEFPSEHCVAQAEQCPTTVA